MSTDFPGGIDEFTSPIATNYQNDTGVKHAKQHSDVNDAVAALETKVGVNNSSDESSLDFLINDHIDDDSNPHTQYQLRSEKNEENGYAGLDGAARIDVDQVPISIPQENIDGTSSGPANLADDLEDIRDDILLKMDADDRGAANGVASLNGSTKVPIAQIPTGSSASTVAIGNDTRLSDTRTPTDATVTQAKMASGLRVPVVCTSGTRPGSPSEGDMIWETNTDKLLMYANGTAGWIQPWNMPWGRLNNLTVSSGDQALDDNDTIQVITSTPITITGCKNRRVKISGQVTFWSTSTGDRVRRPMDYYIQEYLGDHNNTIVHTSVWVEIGYVTHSISTIVDIGNGVSDGTKVYLLAAKPLVFGGNVNVINTAFTGAKIWIDDIGPADVIPT